MATKMAAKRENEGFNLAFLDVMACGLGAVLMILILVKFQSNTSVPTEENERLEQEVATLEQQAQQLASAIKIKDEQIAQASQDSEQIKQNIRDLLLEQQALQQALKDKKAVVANLEDAITATAPKVADDPIELQGSGEENYLLGLKVEGRYIGMLIDTSASMTDEALKDILVRKIRGQQSKQQGPKWQRTKRIAKWLLARLPKTANVTMIAFNKTPTVLGANPINVGNDAAAIKRLTSDIDQLVPQHGTNLYLAIEAIKKQMPKLTDLYIVTDGLPTLLPKHATFRKFGDCDPLSGKMVMITGECRHAITDFTLGIAPRVTTNVVLLPLEGEPSAPAYYWNWTDAFGGLLISPAGNWP